MVNYSTNVPTALFPRDLDPEQLSRFTHKLNIGRIVLLGKHRRTANCQLSIDNCQCYGQNAYDGDWKMIPQIVQKLPTTHSPRITPRKNGSALPVELQPAIAKHHQLDHPRR